MIGSQAEWDRFISEHRWGVLTTVRTSGSPVSAMVAYAREGDTLVVSTPGDRFRVASIRRDPKVNLCVISNAEPFSYVSVEARAEIETEDLVAPTRAVFQAIAGTGYDEPADLAGWIRDDGRVILRLHPQRVFGVRR